MLRKQQHEQGRKEVECADTPDKAALIAPMAQVFAMPPRMNKFFQRLAAPVGFANPTGRQCGLANPHRAEKYKEFIHTYLNPKKYDV